MPAEPKNIRLDTSIFQALQEAAAREGKPLDEMANQAVLTGLHADKLSMVQKVLAKGHHYGERYPRRRDSGRSSPPSPA